MGRWTTLGKHLQLSPTSSFLLKAMPTLESSPLTWIESLILSSQQENAALCLLPALTAPGAWTGGRRPGCLYTDAFSVSRARGKTSRHFFSSLKAE
mmetsp:Transcript_43100/g.87141  ORF Transcript_43100/g.87141 Transcript_43100/m.87141 type:complete len:96 (+) Transcript_43100:1886-2173(+)